VHVAACESSQEAGEYEAPSGWHGTLTWFLCEVLTEVPADTSWRAAVEIVRARIAGLGTRGSQFVHVVGDDRRAVFGGRGRPVPAGYTVCRDARGELRLGAGRIHGLREGTELRLVDADARERGRATVRRVQVSSCAAEVTGGALPPGEALWAIPQSRLEGRAPLLLALQGVDAEWLAQSPWAAVAVGGDAGDGTLARRDGRIALLDRDGTWLRDCAAAPAALQEALFREYCYRSLWQGVARPGTLGLAVDVGPATAEECLLPDQSAVPAARLAAASPGTGARVRVAAPALLPKSGGGMLAITVRNTGDQGVYVALLSVQEDRAVTLLLGGDPNNFVQPGATVRRRVLVGPSPKWDRPRPMVDRYVAIATPRYCDFRPFESEAPIEQTAEKTVATRGASGELPPFLQTALHGSTTRGDAPVWGIAWIDLELAAPAPAEK
jgi:hypothetical protein